MKKIDKVYLVQHVHKLSVDEEDVKIIGIYTNVKRAKKTIEKYKLKPGFKRSKRGFYIDEYILNKDNWVEGFVIVKQKD